MTITYGVNLENPKVTLSQEPNFVWFANCTQNTININTMNLVLVTLN